MSRPIDATRIPRRDPLVQAAIESLQAADDAIRSGQAIELTASLLAAKAGVETLIDRHLVRGRKS